MRRHLPLFLGLALTVVLTGCANEVPPREAAPDGSGEAPRSYPN